MLLLLLVFLSVYSFIFIKEVMPEGSDIRIEAAGKLLYTLPIHINKTVEVNGPLGTTVVEIRDSRVRIKESPCNNKICVHEGWVRSGAIICLPNRVIVSITGKANKKHEDIDGITG